MFTGIEHFAIASPNPKRLAEWYVTNLSFRINYESGGNYFVKAPDGAIIEIIPGQGDRGPNDPKTPGLRHIAVSVDNFDTGYDALKSKGVTFAGQPYESGANRLVFFEDGDGNLVHLIERGKPLPA